MADSFVCELKSTALISFTGEDASSFLHAQLTSDVASLGRSATQYTGYCSPKGRLLATPLLWPRESAILMLLPATLREAIQTRLTKYVLRARVQVEDATPRFSLFGVSGQSAIDAITAPYGTAVATPHAIIAADGFEVTRLPVDRCLLLVQSSEAARLRDTVLDCAEQRPEAAWSALEIDAGIPLITPETQDQYVPQMVNLDLIGAVSYTKGCYPGQEIVARTHYLGKLKQRMYRVHVPGATLHEGDPLYSPEFGPDQASGAILYPSMAPGGHDALAVVQKRAVAGGAVRLKSLGGPAVEILPLPYAIPD